MTPRPRTKRHRVGVIRIPTDSSSVFCVFRCAPCHTRMAVPGSATLMVSEDALRNVLYSAYTQRLAPSRLREVLDLAEEMQGDHRLMRAKIYSLANAWDIEEVFKLPCVGSTSA